MIMNRHVAGAAVGSYVDDGDSGGGGGGHAGNGKIDFGEFLLLVHNYERPLPEDVEVREMFNALDKDKNGYIDRDELKSSFAGLGMMLSDDDVADMMTEADVYADRIYFEGLLLALTQAEHDETLMWLIELILTGLA